MTEQEPVGQHSKKITKTSRGYGLKQIAQMTGFQNYKSFLKFFCYHADRTPYEYRKSNFIVVESEEE
jgi:transcriptional regulator GlxA family with amidase domain